MVHLLLHMGSPLTLYEHCCLVLLLYALPHCPAFVSCLDNHSSSLVLMISLPNQVSPHQRLQLHNLLQLLSTLPCCYLGPPSSCNNSSGRRPVTNVNPCLLAPEAALQRHGCCKLLLICLPLTEAAPCCLDACSSTSLLLIN